MLTRECLLDLIALVDEDMAKDYAADEDPYWLEQLEDQINQTLLDHGFVLVEADV